MRKDGKILIAAAVWTIYVWVTRVFTLVRQDATRSFKIVHFVLTVISIAFGIAIARIGFRLLRRTRDDGVPNEERDGARAR